MSDQNSDQNVQAECSMITVLHIGIGTITLDLQGADNVGILYRLKEELINALVGTDFDIQNVETTITEIQ